MEATKNTERVHWLAAELRKSSEPQTVEQGTDLTVCGIKSPSKVWTTPDLLAVTCMDCAWSKL